MMIEPSGYAGDLEEQVELPNIGLFGSARFGAGRATHLHGRPALLCAPCGVGATRLQRFRSVVCSSVSDSDGRPNLMSVARAGRPKYDLHGKGNRHEADHVNRGRCPDRSGHLARSRTFRRLAGSATTARNGRL